MLMKRETTEERPAGWNADQLWEVLGAVQRDRRRLWEQREEAREIARKLLHIAECRGPKVFGPRPYWLKDPDEEEERCA